MFEAIEKLRDIKANILYERNEIDTEVEQIDVAIEKFREVSPSIFTTIDKPSTTGGVN